jgi:hypothetical protein
MPIQKESSIVGGYQHFGGTCWLHLQGRVLTFLPWEWRPQGHTKQWSLCIVLCSITSQKTVNFIAPAMVTSRLRTFYVHFICHPVVLHAMNIMSPSCKCRKVLSAH